MADPRLQWRQINVAQPNVAGLLRNSRDGINEAAAAAEGILGRYEEGRTRKADELLARELAGIGSEEELDAWIDAGNLNGHRGISESMRDSLLAHRTGQVNNANTRDTIRSRGVRDGIALNVDNRAQGDWNWKDGRRRELAGLSDEIVGARTEGQDFGSNGREVATTQARVYQGLLDRGIPEHIAQGFMMNFQDESGFQVDINEREPLVPGSRGGRGLYQLTGPRRRAFEAKYGEDGYTIDNQLDFLMEELGGSESRAWATIQNSQNAQEAAANIVNNFLRPAPDYARERTARYVGEGFQPFQATTRATPARDALESAVSGSQFLSPEDITGLLNDNDSRIGQGDARIEAEVAAQNEAIIAQLTMDAVANPANTTPAQVQQEVAGRAEAAGMSSSEVLQAQRAAEQIVESSAGIQTQLAPEVEQDVRFSNIVEGASSDINRALDSTVMGRMTRDIQTFSEAENPTDALMDTLGSTLQDNAAGPVGAFFSEGGAGADRNDITNMINRYAQQFKVTPEVAAAAMREAFVDDPLTFIGNANTLENRFDEDRVGAIIEQYTNQDNQSQFGDATRSRREVTQRLNTLNDSVVELQREAAKTQDPQRRNAIAQRIAEIYTEMSTIRSNAQQLYQGQ